MSINLNLDYTYDLLLVKTGTEEILGYINYSEFSIKRQSKNIDEIKFVISRYINEPTGIISNPIFLINLADYLIKLNTKIGDTIIRQEYFIVNQPDDNGGEKEFKQVNAYSWEYQLGKINLTGFKTTTQLWDATHAWNSTTPIESGILNYILENLLYNSWTVNYMDASLVGVYRTFDISESTVLSEIRELENNFQCVFEFDTFNKYINIKKNTSIGENKGLVISDENILKNIKISHKNDQIQTRLFVYGTNNISIGGVNQTGQNYLDDFSVFRNLNFMSSSLLTALTDYDALYLSLSASYNTYQSQKTAKQVLLLLKQAELATYTNQLNIIKDNQDSCILSETTTTAGISESTNNFDCIIWNGTNRFLIGTDFGTIYSYVSGWNIYSSTSPYKITTIIFANNQYTAINISGIILTSSDGISWTENIPSNPVGLYGLVYGNKYVAIGSNGTVITSTDTVTWTNRTSGINTKLNNIAWNGSIYTSVGLLGKIITSSDGIIWTERSSGTTNELSKIIWTGSQFVIVGDVGTILTSSDGITWTLQTSNSTEWLKSIVWNGSLLVSVGSNGAILSSSDGITWISRTSGTTKILYDIAWNGTIFKAVGENQDIVNSTDGINWTNENIANYNYSYWRAQEIFKKSEITSKNNEITTTQNQINSIENSIKGIVDALDYDNFFTSDQLKELLKFIRYGKIQFTTDNPDELLAAGQLALSQKSKPYNEYSIDIASFLDDVYYQGLWNRFILGDKVNLDYSNLGLSNVELKLVEYTHSPENPSLQVVLSNRDEILSDDLYLNKILDNMNKASINNNIERNTYKLYTDEKGNILFTNQGIDAAVNPININSDTTLSNRGLESKNKNNTNAQLRVMYDRIVMTLDGWDTFYNLASAQGLSTGGLNNDRLIADQNGLAMYNDQNQKNGLYIDKSTTNKFADVQLYFNDNEIFQIRNGIDFLSLKSFTRDFLLCSNSELLTRPQDNWVFDGNVSGSVYVDASPPINPLDSQVMIDTDDYTEYQGLSKTTTSSLLKSDAGIVYCNGTFTINLPQLDSSDIDILHFIFINENTGIITVNGNGLNINGATSKSISNQYDIVNFYGNYSKGWYAI